MALAGPTRRPKVTARAPTRPTSRAPAPRRFDRHALIDTLKILRQLVRVPVRPPPTTDPAVLTNGRTRAARGGHDAPNHTMNFARTTCLRPHRRRREQQRGAGEGPGGGPPQRGRRAVVARPADPRDAGRAAARCRPRHAADPGVRGHPGGHRASAAAAAVGPSGGGDAGVQPQRRPQRGEDHRRRAERGERHQRPADRRGHQRHQPPAQRPRPRHLHRALPRGRSQRGPRGRRVPVRLRQRDLQGPARQVVVGRGRRARRAARHEPERHARSRTRPRRPPRHRVSR